MGSCFIPVGNALTAAETDVSSCDKCFFDDKPSFCSLFFCNKDSRTDGKNVVYKLVDIESEKQKVETMRGNINPEYTIAHDIETRDWFAIQLLPAIIIAYPNTDSDIAIDTSYSLADMMIERRGKQ